jgi:alanyl-tRNA synthetase
VRALGDIGPVKVVSEGSIGSNLRRIEAITGTAPIERLREEEATLARLAQLLNVPVDEVVDGVERRLGELKALRDELRDLRRVAAGSRAADLAADAVDGVVVARIDGTARDELRDLAVAVRDRDGVRAVVIGGAPEGGGAALVVATAGGALDAKAVLDATEPKSTIKGGGGGNAELASAGGKDPSGIDEALDRARAALGDST